ncbi:MAG: RDD family protein [Bacteroidetes bacterium]|nr:MAG: RDD family protein [Bacteroidota bacterium]
METSENPYVGTGTEQLATEGQRIGAYLIDILMVMVVSIVPIVGGLVGLAYMLTRDSLPFLDGQSVGKKVLKIRAVTEDGGTLANNWGPGLIRNVVLLIPFFPLVELIVLFTNADNRRLGDQWGKTKVIVDPGA